MSIALLFVTRLRPVLLIGSCFRGLNRICILESNDVRDPGRRVSRVCANRSTRGCFVEHMVPLVGI